MLYNVKRKTFPGGLIQYKFYSFPQSVGFPNEVKSTKESGNTTLDSIKSSRKRSKNNIYDLARCVEWDYFITLTLDSKYCDRFDYSSACSIILNFTKWCRRHSLKYLIVPEQHKNGAWHFHALIQCDNKSVYDLMLVDSGHKSKTDIIYNIKSFRYGFTTATKIKSSERVSSYITKYVTKSFSVPRGKKRYWVSRNISRPTECSYLVDSSDLEEVINHNADYSKVIGTKFNELRLYEIHKKCK